MEWTGIQNENEFYSAYFFSEGLMEALKEKLDKWSSDEKTAKEEAEEIGAATYQRSPTSRLRLACRELAIAIDDLPRTRGAARLDAEREINNRLLEIFGLPRLKSQNAEFSLEPFFPNGEAKPPVALVGQLFEESNASTPAVWVLEASSLGQPSADETDPLEWKVAREQFKYLPSELPKRAEELLETQTWSQILRANVFECDNPPRWVVLVAGTSWILIDRTKWSKNSCLRFDWKEITTRRAQNVLEACAALLSAESMVGVNGRVLLESVDENSHKQAYGVSENLKRSLRSAIELLGNEAAGQLIKMGTPQKNLADILTRECLRYMYRILFLLFVESRKELHYAPVDNPAYATAYSFESLRDLEMIPLMTEEDLNGRYFHDSITKLFRFFEKGTPSNNELTGTHVNAGAAGFGISPLRGALFDSSRTPYLNKVVFTNKTLQQVVQLMSLSSGTQGKGRKRARTGRISYAHLGINQLGAVYEALLSYRGFFAKEDLFEVRPEGGSSDEFETGYFVTATELHDYEETEKVYVENDDGEKVLKRYPKGTFIYRLTGREREKSASYYTPEILTQCVVKYALKEYFETVIDKLPTDKEKADKILSLRICEPAMGSAAFLNEAINQLSVRYMEHAQKAKGERLSLDKYAKELQRVKMYLADNCVFGVDLNPVAVELAEVSLWLNALSDDKFVPWFGLQLHAGNSLVGCRRTVYTAAQLCNGKTAELEPIDIGAAPLEDNQIWQFLVPNATMADYKSKDKDKDVQTLFSSEMETLNQRRKQLFRKIRREDARLMLSLSKKAEKLWQSWAKKLATLRAQTSDPYAIYGHEEDWQDHLLSYKQKNQLTEDLQNGDGREESGEFMRLKMAMNYWCSLWFWPIDKAADFPTLDEFLADMGTLLSSEVLDTSDVGSGDNQLDLFEALMASEEVAEDSSGRIRVSDLKEFCPHVAISEEVAQRYRFFHWPLIFADLFIGDPDHVGFDLTFGNPPWRVPSWNSGAVIGDFVPHILFRKFSASKIQDQLLSTDGQGRTFFARRPDIAKAWRSEYEESTGLQLFLGNKNNYPETQGSSVNLFKLFLPLTWRNATKQGVQGFLHPLTNLTDTKGISLRKHSYNRLRFLFKFTNEEDLFGDVGHQRQFSISIYGENKNSIEARAIMNLFHPKTIDDTFESTDDSIADGIKDKDGKWNHKGQKDRLITLNKDVLEDIARVFADNLTAPVLPDIHSESLLKVMQKFAHITTRIRDLGEKNYSISRMWDETNACKDGIIQEFPKLQTKQPASFKKIILNGPHISVANPIYKNPNNPCLSKSDWGPIDLNLIPDDFIPRCKYEQECNDTTYTNLQKICKWDKKPFDQHWRVAYREMVILDGERTLTSGIYPAGVSCVHTVNMLASANLKHLLSIASSFATLPLDAYVRMLGKGHLQPAIISGLPLVNYEHRYISAISRYLALICLILPYSSLWKSTFCPAFLNEHWTQEVTGLDSEWFSKLTPEWTRNCALRSDLMRRQALLELDVLTAQAMGLDLRDLLTLYRLRFRVMRGYDANTWYDQKGRVVFTTNKGLSGVGLSRKKQPKDAAVGITYCLNGYAVDAKGLGFENIKDMKEGHVEKRFPDISMTDKPVMTTVRYEAPFFQMDREADYRRAWEVFEKRFGKVGEEHSASTTEPPSTN